MIFKRLSESVWSAVGFKGNYLIKRYGLPALRVFEYAIECSDGWATGGDIVTLEAAKKRCRERDREQ